MDRTEIEAMAASPAGSDIGDAGSAGGRTASAEVDDLYYIPERRASLDLGWDSSDWQWMEQALSPSQSYSSMRSDDYGSSDEMEDKDGTCTRVQMDKADSFSSCYSLDSDDCERRTRKDRSKENITFEMSKTPNLIQNPDEFSHPSLTVKSTFKTIMMVLDKLSEGIVGKFRQILWKHYPQSFNTNPHSVGTVDKVHLVDHLLECYSLQESLQITKAILEELELKNVVQYLQRLCTPDEVRYDLSMILRRKYSIVHEDLAMQGETRAFEDIFSDLYITSKCDNGPNIEHEVMHIEKLDTNRNAGKELSCKDILSPESIKCSLNKLVLTFGVAGSGKTMAVRKLILDWIEERSHQHVSFLFPLTFRELNAFEGSNVSLLGIIQSLYPETKKLKDEDFRSEECQMMFVFDGLDEYTGELDFSNTELLGDHTDLTSLNVIVVNILRQRLLYRGMFWVTSRPQIKRCVPWDMPCDKHELHGFRDSEKEDYFRKRFKDLNQAARVIAHLNSSKTLQIMCHLPLFCSVLADVFQRVFQEQGPQAELPRSITYMYTNLLLVLLNLRSLRAPNRSLEEEREFLMKLGKMAFVMLERGQFRFSESHWKEFGVSDEEAVVKSGLCTQFDIKPLVLVHERAYSFIHPTVQEYLAALYAFLSFRNHSINVLEQKVKKKLPKMLKMFKEMDLYKSAVDRSLHDEGKLDIFLRFLLGMTLKTNQQLLQRFCTSSVMCPSVIDDAAALISKKITENKYPGRVGNLKCCLVELGVGASQHLGS
ncbi:NLR family CARD domain-containing protein 3-like isoform X1 [Thalassophryne amazonica]|uniref:NLR family CARD domain-containing protein 3-like isoform X1 n=1 Tax=Thalassophryne amazonica TaxID=390379 RepID=UPI0014721F8E|nr:NLR family CARD domain-containing protein 3-like isoform X1 [Thalassophryne amazonica]